MEEKDDLMKNIMDDNNKNLKKYLLMGGATFVIFVVGIVIAKFAFGDSKDNTQIILPPDATSNSKNQKEASDLFNSINVEKNDNNRQTTQNKKVVEDNAENDNEFKKPEPTRDLKQDVKQNVNEIQHNVEKKIEETKNKLEEGRNNLVTNSKKDIKVVVTNKNNNFERKKIEKTKNIIRNYYIQVAAITRGEPSTKFLGLIKENGFNYKIREIEINSRKIKRVLVGPFTVEEAKNSLPKVREKITSSAFIKKIK